MSRPLLVLDRIEGERAILTFGDQQVDLPIFLLPEGAREGSVLCLALDEQGADEARLAAEARLARLRARDPNPPTEFDL